MTELLEIIDKICKAPGMFFSGKTFGEFVAFIYGFNFAKDNKPLKGFKEWLVIKVGNGNNLTWDGLAKLYLNARFPSVVKGNETEHLYAIKKLTNLIKVFFHDKRKRGLQNILDEYKEWLESQERN